MRPVTRVDIQNGTKRTEIFVETRNSALCVVLSNGKKIYIELFERGETPSIEICSEVPNSLLIKLEGRNSLQIIPE